jgi:hypothetical protein
MRRLPAQADRKHAASVRSSRKQQVLQPKREVGRRKNAAKCDDRTGVARRQRQLQPGQKLRRPQLQVLAGNSLAPMLARLDAFYHEAACR